MEWVRNQVGARVNFFRVDIGTPAGRAVMNQLNIKLNSTYVIFDQAGNEVWRSYEIPLNGKPALRILRRLPGTEEVRHG